MSDFVLGKKSLSNLIGVHPQLGFAASEAIKLTTVDFSVFDGIRTQREQEVMVAVSASRTLDSYHLYGLAIDLVPWVNSKSRWEEELFKPIAKAMDEVIHAHGLDIEWGYMLWGFDMPHYQMTNYKHLYDVRNLSSEVG